MSLGRKAMIGVGWVFAWRAFARLLSFISTLTLARLLVPADFGLVAMALTLIGAIGALANFPIFDALMRRPEEDTRLHDVAFTIQVARAFLMALALAAVAPAAAAWYGEPRLTPMVLAIAGMEAVTGFSNVGMVQFQRELRFDMQFKLQILPAILQLLATLLIAWLTGSYWALLVGMAVLRITRVGMSYVIHPYRPRFSLVGWQELIGFSFWLWLAGLAAMVWGQTDSFVIGPLFGSATLGLYVLASQVAGLPVSELLEPLNAVLFASFAHAQRDRTSIGINPMTVAVALLLLMAPIALVISAEAGSIVHLLLGNRWLAAVPLVVIAAWRVLLHPFHVVSRSVLIARGRVRQNFWISLTMTAGRVALITVAALTGSLVTVIEASLVILTAGALLYGWALWADFKAQAGRLGMGLLRIAIATAGAGLVLKGLGLGWQATVPAAPAHGLAAHATELLYLGGAATVAALTYLAVLGTLWLAAGRPSGPEQLLLNRLNDLVPGRVRGRLVRLGLPLP